MRLRMERGETLIQKKSAAKRKRGGWSAYCIHALSRVKNKRKGRTGSTGLLLRRWRGKSLTGIPTAESSVGRSCTKILLCRHHEEKRLCGVKGKENRKPVGKPYQGESQVVSHIEDGSQINQRGEIKGL